MAPKMIPSQSLRSEWWKGYEQGRRDEFDALSRLGLAKYERVFLKLGLIGLAATWAALGAVYDEWKETGHAYPVYDFLRELHVASAGGIWEAHLARVKG